MSQRPERSLRRRALGAVVVGLVFWLTPSVAKADDALRFSVDWDKLGVILHEGTSSLLPHESWHAETPDAKPVTLLGVSPRLALVARDWGVSQVLWGHLAVSDQLRLSRSSRMVMTRVRLGGGLLSPFAHVGVGQWRPDTSVVPVLRSDADLAGQMGGGFELELAPRAVLALEGDCTGLYREGRDAQALSRGQVWSTLLAAEARF